MRINQKGVTRIVLVFREVVVKIPRFNYNWTHFLRGLIGNIDEGETWRYNSGKFERGHSHLLCPVVWMSWGGWILIMKRATPLTLEDWEKIYDITEYKKHFGGDDTMSNYGYYKGSLVKIDYASLDNYWGSDFKTE